MTSPSTRPEVKVLLSAYNGEAYIREQLDSILSQSNVDVRLRIRDDGSTDGTRSILREYEGGYENVEVEYGSNMGPCASFLALLYGCSGSLDFVAFSDQDDIWEAGKIERAIHLIGETREPTLYYSALKEFYCSTGETRVRANKREFTFFESLLQSHYPGCTMVMNQPGFELVKSLEMPSIAVMHDAFVAQVFLATGYRTVYDEESFIIYRIHGNNVSVKQRGAVGEFKRLYGILKHQKGLRLEAAGALYRSANRVLDAQAMATISEVMDYRKSIKSRIAVACRVLGTGLEAKPKALFACAFLFGFY